MGLFIKNKKTCFDCRHYSSIYSCEKRTGVVLKTNICPDYENYKEYKKELKNKKKTKEGMNDYKINDNYVSFNDTLENSEDPVFETEFNLELEQDDDTTTREYKKLTTEQFDYFESKIVDLRKSRNSNIKLLLSLSDDLDLSVSAINNLKRLVSFSTEFGIQDKECVDRLKELVIFIEKRFFEDCQAIKKEFDWYYYNKKTNIAYKLAEVLSKSKIQEYRDILTKFENKM